MFSTPGQTSSRNLAMMPVSQPRLTLAPSEATHTSLSASLSLVMARTSSKATSCTSTQFQSTQSTACKRLSCSDSILLNMRATASSACVLVEHLCLSGNEAELHSHKTTYKRVSRSTHQILGEGLRISVVHFMQLQEVSAWLSSLHIHIVDSYGHELCLVHGLGLIKRD